MLPDITLNHIGFRFTGTATINHWGGGQSEIDMKAWTTYGELDEQKMLEGINDAGFGCESIDHAEITCYALYDHGHVVYDYEDYITSDRIPMNPKIGV